MKEFINDRILYFWLTVSDVSPSKINALILHYGGIRCFYEHFLFDAELRKNLGATFEKLKKAFDEDILKKELDKIERAEISFLTPLDAQYPKGFLELNDAPFVIFYKGRLDLINTKCFTIVGTRNPSNYGKKMTRLIFGVDTPKDFNVFKYLGNVFPPRDDKNMAYIDKVDASIDELENAIVILEKFVEKDEHMSSTANAYIDCIKWVIKNK